MKYIKSFIEKNNENLKIFLRINSTIFPIIIIIYLLLLIINQFWDRFFEDYLNINSVFILLLVSGIFFILPIFEEKEKVIKKRKLEREDIFLFLIMGLICSVLVWTKIKSLGTISYIISGIAGLITIILSMLIFNEQ